MPKKRKEKKTWNGTEHNNNMNKDDKNKLNKHGNDEQKKIKIKTNNQTIILMIQ